MITVTMDVFLLSGLATILLSEIRISAKTTLGKFRKILGLITIIAAVAMITEVFIYPGI
jgi:hypothetical protein